MTYQPSVNELRQLGWNIIPINPESKTPMIRWKANQEKHWDGTFPDNCSYAAIMGSTTGYIVVDTDSPESEALISKQVPPTSIMAKSKKGFHRYYRWMRPTPTMLKFDEHKNADLKADKSYVLIPPSKNYEWLAFDPSNVPEFSLEWLDIKHRRTGYQQIDTRVFGIQNIDSIISALLDNGSIIGNSSSGTNKNIYVRRTFDTLLKLGYSPSKENAGPMKSNQVHVNGMMVLNPSGLIFISNAGGTFCKVPLKISDQFKLYEQLKGNNEKNKGLDRH